MGSRPVPLPGPQVKGVIHGKSNVATLLSRRQAGVFDRTRLAVLLTCEVLVCAVPPVERAPAQDFALWADQVIAVIHKPASGDHIGFLDGMDGNLGRDIPFFQQLPKLTCVVACVP